MREENREVGSTLMGRLPQAAPDTQPSGKNRVNKTGVEKKKEGNRGRRCFCLDTVGGRKM